MKFNRKTFLNFFFKKWNTYIERLNANQFSRIDWATLDHNLLLLMKNANFITPIIFDIGANKGQSIERFKQLFPASNIFSFEPDMELFQELTQKYKDNKINIFNFAVGSENGNITFNINQKRVLNSVLQIDTSKDNRFYDKKVINSYTVPLVRLDDFTSTHQIEQKIDLLKIDVQGYDFEVLKGAKKLFQENRICNVLIEMNFFPMYQNQAKPAAIIEFLESYDLYLVGLYEISRNMNHKGAIAWCSGLFTLKEEKK